MATIRELFHDLGNKHNIVTVGCGAAKELVQECLEIQDLPKTLTDNLLKMKKDIDEIIKVAMDADKITVEIHDRIYKVIDPDTGELK